MRATHSAQWHMGVIGATRWNTPPHLRPWSIVRHPLHYLRGSVGRVARAARAERFAGRAGRGCEGAVIGTAGHTAEPIHQRRRRN